MNSVHTAFRSSLGRRFLPAALFTLAVVAALVSSEANLRAILPASQWQEALLAPAGIDQLIAHDSWLPRVLVSCLCGALLGLAGTIFQQVLRNPLAEPMTLGVSAGAQLALTVATLWAPALLAGAEWLALGGALVAAALTVGLSWRSGLAPVTVAVAGLVVTLYCGSIGVALQLFYAPYLRALFIWGGGSLVQQDWSNVTRLGVHLVGGAIAAVLLLRPMSLFGLADDSARSLGLSLRGVRLVCLLVAVVLSAAVVSAVGVIGFVGLAAPALARLAGARRLKQRLVVAPLCGALMVWLTDQALQPFSGALGELVPTGAATALLGAPLLLALLARMRRTQAPPGTGHAADPLPLVTDRVLRIRVLAITVLLAIVLVCALDFANGPHGFHFSSVVELSRVAVWRAPRAFAALGAGAMLAVAGALMQRMTGNPLASPEVLGVSAGAALGLIALIVAGADAGPAARIGASATGALIALLAILWFARRSRFAPERVLLAGIAIGALFQSVVAVAIASGGERATTLLQWLAGSTYSITPNDAMLTVALCLALCALTPLCQRWLQILPLGDAPARALGVTTGAARLALLVLVAALTAAATLIVGPLSFVGLTAPHFARLLGARRPLQHLLLAAPLGALIVLTADWLGRVLLMPRELPAGLVATLIGAPYLMWLLGRRR